MISEPRSWERWAFGGALLCVAAAAIATWLALHMQAQARARANQLGAVVLRLDQTLSTLKDAETGQRGFLLTGQAAFLEPYQAALRDADRDLQSLAALVASDARDAQRIAMLAELSRAKRAELAQTIDLYRSGQRATAIGIVQGREGKRLMDQIRQVVAAFRAEQTRALAVRAQAVAVGERATATVVASLGVLALAALLLVRFVAYRERQNLKLIGAMVAGSSDLVGLLNLERRLMFVNPAGRAMLGLPADAPLPDQKMAEYLIPEDREQYELPVIAAVRATGHWSGSLRLLNRETGEALPVDADVFTIHGHKGRRLGFAVVARNLKDIEAVRTRLLLSEHRFMRVVEEAPYPLFVHAEDGRILAASKALYRLSGYAPEQIPTVADWARLAYGADAAEIEKVVQGLYALDAPVEQGEIVVGTAGGGRRIWRFSTAPVGVDALGQRLIVAMAADVTDLRAQSNELQAAKQELEQRVADRTRALAESNAELRAFAHSMAHDLRAPLRNIEGYATALLEDEAERLSAGGRRYAERLVVAARRLDLLIADLLAYARMSRADWQPERVELSEVLSSIQRDLAAELERRDAHLEIRPPLPAVIGHSATLATVLGNLISNALKFTAEGQSPEVLVNAERRADRVTVSVRDNGIGIDPRHQQRIFRMFERLHGQDAYPGSGMGLAMVRAGVGRLGGRVGVESETGKGSRFWIDLPAAPAMGADTHATPFIAREVPVHELASSG
jgi:PAS domain S-box-containing protein